MLGGVVRFDDPIGPGPSAAWFRDELCLAYADANQQLAVRSVDVLGSGGSTLKTLTYPARGHVTAAADESRLYLLHGEPGVEYWLTSTTDGTTYDAPVRVPIDEGFVGAAGMTVAPIGVVLVWAENAGGQAHVMVSDDRGSSWSESGLAFEVQPHGAAIAWAPELDRFLCAYGARSGGPSSFQLRHLAADDPTEVLLTSALVTPHRVSTIALCTGSYRNTPGFHLAFDGEDPTNPSVFVARSADVQLDHVGAVEAGPRALDLSLANDGRHSWAAWRDDATRLCVSSYDAAFDLPDDLRQLLGERCDPDVCPIDPRLTCQATDEFRWDWRAARIDNAAKGDVILTPGDGAGVIATLLSELEPRQNYDHMGIMLRDRDLVRHATMAHDRIKNRKPGRYMTGSVFGEKAPTNGFRPDTITYGWPGTITQSVEDAFYTGFNTRNPATGKAYNPQGDYLRLNPDVSPVPEPGPSASDDDRERFWKQLKFADPEYPKDEPYAIHNFPWGVAYRAGENKVLEPQVVKPAPALEAADPRIRAVLHRIADASTQIDGHYRFFSYSDARIAFDPVKFGPPAGNALYAGKPPGASWCAATRPLVCSSFVWAAIQFANATNPRIEVEGRATESPEELLSSPPVDGLYRYEEQERVEAGTALHRLLAEQVRGEAYEGLQKLISENALQFPLDLTRIGLTGLMALLTGPIGAAATFLGISAENAADLLLLLNDMPDDVATQMCNAFGKDRADETDDDLWEDADEGLAVSPDDIGWFWDAPDRASDLELWRGLYGTRERLMLVPRRLEPARVHVYQRSMGPAYLEGVVRYRGRPLAGARVQIACQETMTSSTGRLGPTFALTLPSGRYDAKASLYWPDTTEMLTGSTIVELDPGDHPERVEIDLQDPPDWRRVVRCLGKIDTVRRVVIGSDDWAHNIINQQAELTWAPETWGQPPSDASKKTWTTVVKGKHAQRFNVVVTLEVTLNQDLSLTAKAESRLCEDFFDGETPSADQVVTTGTEGPVTIPEGGSYQFTFDHDSGNFPPDRGHVEFRVENLRAPA